MRERPRVKICGITRSRDAQRAVGLGADLLGLNFYSGSPRCVTVAQAREIVSDLGEARQDCRLVGVFVDRPIGEIERIREAIGLDLVQLHGRYSDEDAARLGQEVIRVVRPRGSLEGSLSLGMDRAWALLVDRYDPGLAGGTGRAWEIGRLGEMGRELEGERWLLAGGINPANVAQMIEVSRPWGIDVCSGVEGEPGSKSESLMEKLFAEIDNG